MSNRIPFGPSDKCELQTAAIPIPEFNKDDPESCQAAAEALRQGIIQELTNQRLPAEVIPELAQQVSDAFFQNIHKDGPAKGVASASCNLSQAELLQQLTGKLDFQNSETKEPEARCRSDLSHQKEN